MARTEPVGIQRGFILPSFIEKLGSAEMACLRLYGRLGENRMRSTFPVGHQLRRRMICTGILVHGRTQHG